NDRLGVGTNAPSGKLHVLDGSILASGTTGTTPVSGAGTRMMWIPSWAAFRAGDVTGTQWDNASIGAYSAALGRNTIASNSYAFAAGGSTTASGQNSVAMGQSTTASAQNAVAIGGSSVASGNTAIALGYLNTASGDLSHAQGNNATAESHSQTTIGRFNMPTGSENATTWVAADPLFVIGNGTGSGASRSNAMVVLKNGNVGIGTSSPTAPLDVRGAVGAHLEQAGVGVFQVDHGGGGVHQTSIRTNVTAADWDSYNFTGGASQIIFDQRNTATGGDIAFFHGAAGTAGNLISWVPSLTLKSSGNVGIGTASPSSQLSVAKDINVGGIATGSAPAVSAADEGRIYYDSTLDKFRVSQSGGAYIDLVASGAADNLGNHTATQALQMAGFGINGSTASGGDLTIDSTTNATKGDIALNPTGGLVAIGVASPSYELDIQGGTQPTLRIKSNTNTSDPRLRFDAKDSGASGHSANLKFIPSTTTQSRLGFNIDGSSDLLSIRGDGNVGVGTTSPTAALHIKAGTAAANTAPLKLTAGTNLTAAEVGAIEFDGTNLYFTDSVPTRRTIATTTALGSYLPLAGGLMSGDVNFGSNDITNVGTLQILSGGTEGSPSLWFGGGIGIFSPGPGTLSLTAGSGEKIRLNNTGVVIGSGDLTGTPAGINVRGPDASGTDLVGSDFIIQSGNGTGTGGSGSILFQTAPVAGTGATANTMSTSLAISPSGNVGVGTSSPGNLLTVYG
ncbi:MAG: hypothetical protein ABL958_19530, partial [Bdellovibrionia bacterium]